MHFLPLKAGQALGQAQYILQKVGLFPAAGDPDGHW
jgi:hypothetical protein